MNITPLSLPSLTAPFGINAVRCWRIELDMGKPDAGQTALLSDEERERARCFVFERDRRRYLLAHIGLRHLLAKALNQAAAAPLEIATRAAGKPWLPAAPHLHFNLSHSAGTAVVAISTAAEVGVDVEQPRPVPDALELASSHAATPAELQALSALQPSARERAFLQLWTRKEACLKALGTGLAMDPNLLEVGLAGDAPPRWRTAAVIRPAGRLQVTSCTMRDGLHVALALHHRHGVPAQMHDAATEHAA